MKKFNIHISLIVLVAYLLLQAANVYHYHVVNFYSSYQQNLENPTSKRSCNLLTHDNCIVNSIYKNIHSVDFIQFSFKNLQLNESEYIFIDVNCSLRSIHLTSIKLRSPPNYS